MGGYQERRRRSRVLAAWVWAYYLTPVGPGSSVFKWKGQQYSLDHRKESLGGWTLGRGRRRLRKNAERGGSCGGRAPGRSFLQGEQLTAHGCASS